MNCPNCNSEIQDEFINIQSDIAQCTGCKLVFKISENISSEVDNNFDMKSPPEGTWISRDMDKLTIGATTRSPVAFFMVPFMLIWSGGSIGGIYGSQLISGEFDPFMSLFGIPFLIGSVIFWGLTLMAIWGKVELTLDKNGGKVFTGLGTIGVSKQFKWDEVSSITEKQSMYNYPGSYGESLILEGKRRISFGMGVKSSRRYYLYKSMKIILAKIKLNKRFL
jgi:hypothetical protein